MATKKPKQIRTLERAVSRYVRAYAADTWKGGGDPDDIPAIERELANARKAYRRAINALLVGMFPGEGLTTCDMKD